MTAYQGGSCSCGQPSPDAFLCQGCTLTLARRLGDLPALIADVSALAARQATAAEHGHRQKGDTQPLPFWPPAADIIERVTGELVGIVRHLAESRGAQLPARGPVPLCAWLLANIAAIRLDEAAGEHADAIKAVHDRLESPWQHPEPLRYAGRCDQPDVLFRVTPGRASFRAPLLPQTVVSMNLCGAELFCEAGADTLECTACGAVYDWKARRATMRAELPDKLARPAQIAAALAELGDVDAFSDPYSVVVTSGLIDTWASRGRIVPHGHENGHALYRFGDVMERVDQERERRARRGVRRDQQQPTKRTFTSQHGETVTA